MVLWKLENKIQQPFKIFLFNWNTIISKLINWMKAIFNSVLKWLNNWLKPSFIFKVKEVCKLCLLDKLEETEKLCLLNFSCVNNLCTQCSYWWVFVLITNHVQLLIRIQTVQLKCEIIQIIPLQKKALEVNSILNFSKENYVLVSVCHLKKWLSWEIKSHLERNE